MENIKTYIKSISEIYKTGNATEHSYRGKLETLIESLESGIRATNEPKRQACGAPDYIITRNNVPIGFIEAKDIGKNLKHKEFKNQFDRYRNSLDNLIITDYLEFRFYRNGEFTDTVSIGQEDNGKIIFDDNGIDKFKTLFSDFINFKAQSIKTASKLAKLMAGKAKLMQEIIKNILLNKDNDDEDDNTLQNQLTSFRNILIHDMDEETFADVYSQTIAYGMFAARLHDETLDDFSRQEAAELIPKSNPFLRKLFQYIAGYDLDDRLKWIVDSLADLFRATDIKSIMETFGKTTETTDPIIHFYETFLAEYNPKLRKLRGVYYTPEPVVNFIVRAIDDILKSEFGLSKGLADNSKTTVEFDTDIVDKRSKTGYKRNKKEIHKVQILDPATGTGTFLAEVIKLIHSKYKGMQGIWSNYVEEHLKPRINGFEILMASYSMCHLKLELLLKQTGYKPKKEKRFKVYLTNSLEEAHPDTGSLFASWLSNESIEANEIKRDSPVMVVLGNPPYSGESSNKGEWILNLLNDYKKEPGGKIKLQERNPKWINDDYVKFLKYGQHYIEKNGEGILAFINPHGFLDNPTFRGMRWNLLKTYDKIYIIDLHGNSKKKETCPDGSKDENVFDIMQGVSINIFIKTGKKKENELGKVFHYDLFGKREDKYDFLWENSLKTVPYVELPNKEPNYFMVQKDFESEDEYIKGFSLNELFKVNNVGIVTSRDSFVIDDNKQKLEKRIVDFFELSKDILQQKYKLKENKSWKIDDVRYRAKSFDNKHVKKINYRPFDVKYIYYENNFIERTRNGVIIVYPFVKTIFFNFLFSAF